MQWLTVAHSLVKGFVILFKIIERDFMKKFFGEKQTRFAFRKLAVGLVSAAISSLFFVSIVGVDSVQA